MKRAGSLLDWTPPRPGLVTDGLTEESEGEPDDRQSRVMPKALSKLTEYFDIASLILAG